MSCNGCRVLRKGCSEDCALRPCLSWIAGGDAQGHATVFLAKFFGRASLLGFVQGVPESQRANLFQSLLYEACGRTISPIYGAVGLLWSGQWSFCQQAVERVLKTGSATATTLSTTSTAAGSQPSSGKSSPLPPGTPSSPPIRVPSPKLPRTSSTEVADDAHFPPTAKLSTQHQHQPPLASRQASPLPGGAAPWLLSAGMGSTTNATPLGGVNEKLFSRDTSQAQGVPISNITPFSYWPVSVPFAAQVPAGFPVRGPYTEVGGYRPFGVGGGLESSTEAYMMAAAAMFQSYAGVATPELESMKMMYTPYGIVPNVQRAQAQEGRTSGSVVTVAGGQPSAQGQVAVRPSSADMEGVEPSVNNNRAASTGNDSQAVRGAGGALRNSKGVTRGSGSAVVAPVPRRLNASTSSSPFAPRAMAHGGGGGGGHATSSPPSPGTTQHHHLTHRPQQQQALASERDDMSSVESVDMGPTAAMWMHAHCLQGAQTSAPTAHHHHHHQTAISVLH